MQTTKMMMTKRYFMELSDYNVWANDIVCDWLDKISDEQWNQPVISSFQSIRKTVLHMCGAQNVWATRLNGTAAGTWNPANFDGSKAEHLDMLKKTSGAIKSFAYAFDENNLEATLFFKRLNGEENQMPYYQILAHVFNHSTYHRGQLVNMLRQVGFTNVGSTDLSVFYTQMNSAEKP